MWLKSWMHNEGVGRDGFAETLGIAPQTLSSYCSGKKKPSVKVVVKIHNFTNGQVSFADFFNDRLDPKLETAQ